MHVSACRGIYKPAFLKEIKARLLFEQGIFLGGGEGHAPKENVSRFALKKKIELLLPWTVIPTFFHEKSIERIIPPNIMDNSQPFPFLIFSKGAQFQTPPPLCPQKAHKKAGDSDSEYRSKERGKIKIIGSIGLDLGERIQTLGKNRKKKIEIRNKYHVWGK